MDEPLPPPDDPEPSPEPVSEASPDAARLPASMPTRAERIASRLQRLIGEDETLLVWAQGWVWRESKLPRLLAARTLDFAALTDRSLVMYSTGFFTRRPRRRVYNTRLDQIFVIDAHAARGRRLRVTSRNGSPVWLELRSTERATTFADALIANARPELP